VKRNGTKRVLRMSRETLRRLTNNNLAELAAGCDPTAGGPSRGPVCGPSQAPGCYTHPCPSANYTDCGSCGIACTIDCL
jgi:hypothetical protein